MDAFLQFESVITVNWTLFLQFDYKMDAFLQVDSVIYFINTILSLEFSSVAVRNSQKQ